MVGWRVSFVKASRRSTAGDHLHARFMHIIYDGFMKPRRFYCVAANNAKQ